MTNARHAIRPQVIVVASARAAEEMVASEIAARVRSHPDSVLGLATGNSMRGVYRHLVGAYERGDISFKAVASFNLDEYCGLDAIDPSSFSAYMHQHFLDRVDIDGANAHLPDGIAFNAATDYEARIAAFGGIDLQLLGIGRNGHIGFNEPGSPANSRTRIVDLAPKTRQANAADFPRGVPVPAHAITMGIATILASRRIILLATGAAKADALANAIEGPISPHNPASFLQGHPDVTIVCDEAAAANLRANTDREENHA